MDEGVHRTVIDPLDPDSMIVTTGVSTGNITPVIRRAPPKGQRGPPQGGTARTRAGEEQNAFP